MTLILVTCRKLCIPRNKHLGELRTVCCPKKDQNKNKKSDIAKSTNSNQTIEIQFNPSLFGLKFLQSKN